MNFRKKLWNALHKAFRISKTDLRIRPVHHSLKNRIEANICICFSSYTVYKELERLLKNNQIEKSPANAIEAIKEIRQLRYVKPVYIVPIHTFSGSEYQKIFSTPVLEVQDGEVVDV